MVNKGSGALKWDLLIFFVLEENNNRPLLYFTIPFNKRNVFVLIPRQYEIRFIEQSDQTTLQSSENKSKHTIPSHSQYDFNRETSENLVHC